MPPLNIAMRTDKKGLECIKTCWARDSPGKAVTKFIQHTWQEELGARLKHTDCSTSSFSGRKILFHWREFVDMEAISVLFLGIFFPYLQRSGTCDLTEPIGRETGTNINLWTEVEKETPSDDTDGVMCTLG